MDRTPPLANVAPRRFAVRGRAAWRWLDFS